MCRLGQLVLLIVCAVDGYSDLKFTEEAADVYKRGFHRLTAKATSPE